MCGRLWLLQNEIYFFSPVHCTVASVFFQISVTFPGCQMWNLTCGRGGKDVLPRLPNKYGGRQNFKISGVFMDQWLGKQHIFFGGGIWKMDQEWSNKPIETFLGNCWNLKFCNSNRIKPRQSLDNLFMSQLATAIGPPPLLSFWLAFASHKERISIPRGPFSDWAVGLVIAGCCCGCRQCAETGLAFVPMETLQGKCLRKPHCSLVFFSTAEARIDPHGGEKAKGDKIYNQGMSSG